MSLPPPIPAGPNFLRIAGLVLLAGVVLCGLVGSCLLVLNLVVAPFVAQ